MSLENYKKKLIRTMKLPNTYKLKKYELEVSRDDNYITFIRYSSLCYEDVVIKTIRTKYSIDQELAILRQRDTKPIEYNEYFNYVEECKTFAKEFIKERQRVLGYE